MKNIVVLCGSPRKNGNSSLLADAFIEGAEREGNKIQKIYVADKKIGYCKGCNYCFNGGKCIQNDDMTEIYEILNNADVLVISTPVYFYNISAQLKTLIDRLHNPVRNGFKIKKLALLAVGASTLPFVFDAVLQTYNSVLKYFNLQDGGKVFAYGVNNVGDILNTEYIEQAKLLGENI